MTEVAAGIYCRISLAGMGDTTKTDDQERISRDLAKNLGWPVVKVYTDHSKSAWQKNRKRDGWDEMLADIESGRISAVIVYHGDRLIRQPFDLEKLLNLADGKGIQLAAPTGKRSLDSAEDRFILRIEAAMACRESDNLSRRRKAQYVRWRRDGRVAPGGTGGRRYGFETDGVTTVKDEAYYLAYAARLILEGFSTGSVATWLNDAGTTTVTGRPFDHTAVRKLLSRARYAGLMPDGVTPAAWPAIIPRADWETIQAILAARTTLYLGATNQARYLLSGIALCGACGQPLQMRTAGGKLHAFAYACKRRDCGKVYRAITLVDAYVGRRVVARLNRPDNPAATVPERPGLAAEFRTLTEARAELAVKVADPAQPYVDLLTERLRRLDERIAQLRDTAGDAARLRLVRQHHGITWEEWEAADLAVRRALVAATFRIEILPSSRRGPGFNPRDIRMTAL